MTIEDESRRVAAGDAIYIPPNLKHGIKNIGDDVLEYLTANAPVFSDQYESALWPSVPSNFERRFYPAVHGDCEDHAARVGDDAFRIDDQEA